MSRSGDDDFERRFSELMAQEFPDDQPTEMAPRPTKKARRPAPEPVTIFERMDAADDAEWERGENRVRPEPLPPLRPWSTTTKLGAGLMALSAVMTLLIVFGVPLPGWLNTVAMVAFVVGLATLLFRLLRTGGPNRHDGDDGARL